MKSCIYRGRIFHKRFKPVAHGFNYDLDYLYLDLDEVDKVFSQSSFWSKDRLNLVNFRRMDYLPSSRDLKAEVIHRIREHTGNSFKGEIRMLATLRSLGYCMNPISLFYCFESNTLAYVVVEVHNTPWNQRHVYVLKGPEFDQHSEKDFHVSPFMPMDTTYEWGIGDPQEMLNVSIKVTRGDEPMFIATMALSKIEITKRNIIKLILSHTRQAFKIISSIYFEALRLWIKRVPFYSHPDKNNFQGNPK